MLVVQGQGQVAVQASREEENKHKLVKLSKISFDLARENTSMKIIHSINFCACEVERIQIREHRLE